jgi:hypothetical protein
VSATAGRRAAINDQDSHTVVTGRTPTWHLCPAHHNATIHIGRNRGCTAVYGTFDQHDIVPIGYALFAFALGVTAGLVTRRMLPAMALTLAGLLTIRIMVTAWIRPLVVAPQVVSMPLDPDTTGYGSGGNILLGIGPSTLQPTTPAPEAVRQRMHDYATRIGENYHEAVTYQPGDRYWTFQWWELALFALVTAVLCGYAHYRLRRFRG